MRVHLLLVLCAGAAISTGCGVVFSSNPEESAESLRKLSQERLATIEGTLSTPGLSEPVEIVRDKWGVAHIYAKNTPDLFFAQGYVAAQDRLYQMEIWRRTGTGELSDVFGPEYVARDRMARLVRYRGDWEEEWASYGRNSREIAEAFTKGINAFVRQAGDKLPIEFALLDFRPGVWKPEDVTLRIAGLLMTRNTSQELMRAEALAKLGPEKTARFLPPEPERPLDPPAGLELDGLSQALDLYRRAVSIPRLEEVGSNNWVVDGTLSKSGKPLLAGDPHRPVVLPSLRYLVHLNAPGWNVIGSGEPALPGVAIGHNDKVGWAFTIVPYDQSDLFIEKVDFERGRYLYRGDWRPLEEEKTLIQVRGEKRPRQEVLRYTKHGPIIWEDAPNNRAVALRWVGSEPGTAGYLGSLALDQASNGREFVEAAKRWKVPAENLVYADRDGHIGWVAAGLVPLRSWSGMFPVPGESGQYEWSGFRELKQLPQIRDPEQHFIATANHNILPEGYKHPLAYDWASDYRYQRIAQTLRNGDDFTVKDFQKLQHDEVSIPALELIALLKEVPPAAISSVAKERALLEGWDGDLDRDSSAALLFEYWFQRLPRAVAAALLPAGEADLVGRSWAIPVWMRELRALPERNQLLADTLKDSVKEVRAKHGAEMKDWKWGMTHTITFEHPLANNQSRMSVFNLGPVRRGGDGNTPNSTSGSGFRQSNGASYRHVLDLSDWDSSTFTSTPGQSGQPESRYYSNLLEMWAEQRYAPLVFSRKAVEDSAAQRLTLTPAR